MADFPTFGSADREAPLFQKELFPNIQFATSVSSIANLPKTVLVAVSIVNLRTDLVFSTLDRIFSYANESVGNELNSSLKAIESENLVPTIHFEIDIAKAVSQSLIPATTPGGLATPTITTVRTAKIDILIENLQVSLLAATLQRIKTYMAASVAADLNP